MCFLETLERLQKGRGATQLNEQKPPRTGEKLRLGPKRTHLASPRELPKLPHEENKHSPHGADPQGIWTPKIREKEG